MKRLFLIIPLILILVAAKPYVDTAKMAFFQALISTRAVELGFIPGVSFDTKFGFNNDIDSAATEIMAFQGGSFSVPTAAETLSIVSSNINDTSAGTGARVVRINCVQADYTIVDVTVSLNGTTPVVTTEQCLAANRAVVLSAGSGMTNAGNITITQSSSGDIVRIIPAGDSISQSCLFVVPDGKRALIEDVRFTSIKPSGGGNPEVQFRSAVYLPATNTMYQSLRLYVNSAADSTSETSYPFTQALGEKSWLWFTVSTNTNDTQATCRYNLILIDDWLYDQFAPSA